jgi:PAS domain S-box-containing protein
MNEMSDSEQLALLQRAFDVLPSGVLITDCLQSDDPIVYVNQSFLTMTGYSEGEVIGQNCRFLQGDQTDPMALAELAKAVHAHEKMTVRLVNYRKDGESFLNEFTIFPIKNAQGVVTHCLGIEEAI